MKKFFQLCVSLGVFALGYSQELRPIAEKVHEAHLANKTFAKFNLFTEDASSQKKQMYELAAADITVMKLNKNEMQRVIAEKPAALEMDLLFEGKTMTLELVKNSFFTHDFKVNTDKGYVAYTPGVYYHGIVKGDKESVVAISFFNDDIIGVSSVKNIGNIVLGKTKNGENYVTYNDSKLKEENPFSCGVDELLENQKMPVQSYNPKTMTDKKTDNCVRIYYEAGYGPYTQNGSNVTTTTNWVSAMHNNINTLYTNDGITVSLSEVFVWTSTDPFTGTPSEILNKFRNYRTTFNGDVAQLLRNPATTSIAWVNALCTTYKYSYSGVNFSYNNVPVYSWNIEAMTHEIGHNLGSPHTHACRWNGDNTAIDGCGPASGNNEGCNGPLPAAGGTIMSYCHLVQSVGINFANGFGPQPGALIRNTINSKGCLGTNCITSCEATISGLTVNTITQNSLTATIIDNTATSWKYKFAKMDGTVISSGVTTNKVLTFNTLDQGTYYTLAVGTDCSGPQAYSYQQLVLTDADWCSGVLFTDSGGANANYGDGENIVKTFYPNNPNDKVKLVFTEFSTEANYDFMNVYDGPNIASPRFPNGTQLSGNTIPGPFQSTHSSGAVTVRFLSDAGETAAGWKATVECVTLATNEANSSKAVKILPTATKGVFTISATDKIVGYAVYDISGKLLTQVAAPKSGSETLDLSKSPAGIYMVSVSTTKETIVKKVIK